jgi:CopG antitoxin of type II toxin-antitoxin system
MEKTTTTTRLTDEGFAIVECKEDIPQFASEAEEAEYWSTHTFSEKLLDQFKSVPDDGGGILPPARKPTYPVSLRLDNDVVHRLRVLAAKKRMRYQTLLKQLLTERLYEEEKREGLV